MSTATTTPAYEDTEANNPNKGWPIAAVVLFFAAASLAAHILGFTAA